VGDVRRTNDITGCCLVLALAFVLAGGPAAADTTPTTTTQATIQATATPMVAPLVLAPGDEVLLEFPHQPELGGVMDVDVRGAITVSPAGPCRVAGLACDVAADSLSRKLGEFFQRPDGLAIRVLRRRLAVRVEGHVAKPGDYLLAPHADLEDALLAAGGITEGGQLTRVLVDRGAGSVTVDLRAYRVSGDHALLPTLRSGDRLFVPVSDRGAPVAVSFAPLNAPLEDESVVHVLGQVPRGGTHAIPHELTLFEALALGGGTSTGADVAHISIIPPRGQPYRVDLEACVSGREKTPVITPGTVVMVPERRRGFVSRTLDFAVPALISTFIVRALP
jgi:protein involved in polysaccharide export with SLBB domain